MLFKVLIIAVMLECIAADSRLGADKGYKLEYFAKLSFSSAVLLCRYHNLQLATIETQEQQDYLANLIKSSGFGNEYFWVGGSDWAQEGIFSWTTGNRFGYTNWNTGQPDNYGNNENCVHLVGNQKWNDIPCKNEYYFVCQKPVCVTCY